MKRRLVCVVVLCMSSLGITASVAPAATSCTPYTVKRAGMDVRYCRLWTAPAPAFAHHELFSVDGPREHVGYLYVGGSSNWFVCQRRAEARYYRGGHYHNWYAWTMTDADFFGRREWGWVPLTYFANGGDDERDSRLRGCRRQPPF